MTLEEAIKHCLEVAEKNDGEAEVYGLLAQNHNSTYEKLTAAKFEKDCAECAADHRQLAEWLMEYKDLKAEQNDQYVFIHELMSELKEAKRLLRLAVDDFDDMHRHIWDCNDCKSCPLSKGERGNCGQMWRYTDEAEKLLKDGESNG